MIDEQEDLPVRQLVEKFSIVLSDEGIQRTAARVLAVLALSEAERMTAGELSRVLEVSPAAVSGSLRHLVSVGLLTKERQRGNLADFYKFCDDLWYARIVMRTRFIAAVRGAVADGIDLLGAHTAAGRRLINMRDLFEFMLEEVPSVLKRWRSGRRSMQDTRPDSAP